MRAAQLMMHVCFEERVCLRLMRTAFVPTLTPTEFKRQLLITITLCSLCKTLRAISLVFD